MRKPVFWICETKGADRAADQRLSFRYLDSTIPLLKYEISCLLPCSVAAQPGLCRTWSENPEGRFSHDAAQMLT